jgi:predicted DNA-binding transcriptional regulator YafY
VLTLLRRALADEHPVSLGYVDSDGEPQHMLITPMRLAAGTLVAMDHGTGQLRSFTVARITGAASP